MMEKVELIKNDGSKLSLDLLSMLNAQDNNKKYIILTANEIDQNGLIKVLVSEIDNGKLVKVTNDNDWSIVKNIMRAIISSSKGNFEYLSPNGSALSFVINDDFARVIAVQEPAKEQLTKDYEAKKPAPQIEKPKEEPKPVDPNAAIYPQSDSAQPINNEITPGIAEVANTPITSVASEMPSDEPAFENVAPEVETVKNVEVPNDDTAKQIMMNKIMAAVEEYLKTNNGSSQSTDLEIDTLKNNIKVMQDQLNAMANAINTQE
jgi:uncharacterized protein YrzB (UPF0473 family)